MMGWFDVWQLSLGPSLATVAEVGQTLVVYEWLRAEQLDQWWHWILLLAICAFLLLYVLSWYRKDAEEQTKPVGWALALLRVGAFVGLFLYFMQLDKRTEQRVVRDSKVAVLVDTSLSMTLPGTPSEAGVSSPVSRADEATRLIGQSDFLQQLSAEHQVSVYRFDQLDRPAALAALDKTPPANPELPGLTGQESANENSTEAILADTAGLKTDGGSQGVWAQGLESGRRLTWIACGLGTVATVMVAVSFAALLFGGRTWFPGSVLLLAGTVFAGVGLVVGALGIVPNTQYSIAALFGADASPVSRETVETPSAQGKADQGTTSGLPDDLDELLTPRGIETRLGDAIKSVLDRETGAPLAGIVVLTDGRSNAGIGPRQVLAVAQNARVPLYMIGLGSPTSPPNVSIAEIDVPKRLYPGDRFSVSALIGSAGYAGRMVTVQALSGPVDAGLEELSIEAEQEVEIRDEAALASAKFELEPKAVGKWQYAVRLVPLTGDADPQDDVRATTVEVIERKNRVLIVAGGPTREYQFVRNLLYRDRDVESHVLLQTGTRNTSQEAQQLLSEFPTDRAALAAYDAVIAFDADWTQIPDSSVTALEQWVAEQAGGFIMVAGSVEMPKWLSRSAAGSKSNNLMALSPVVLERRGSALIATGRVEAETAWPLTLTSDGLQSDFLWLTDEPKSSQELWADFEGVYSYHSAYALKPGAKALLNFSDPTAALDGQPPIYLATQFYGAGRTAFIGGGELWRIRRLGDQYFDRFYTKLIRWVSQGRLLLDSDRGVLLVDREQAILGDQVGLRAVLKNERYEPLVQSEVVARLIDPMERNVPIVLRPMADGLQPGVYTGQFPILIPGEYTAQIQLGGLASEELLNVSVSAKVPALEMQRAERNDDLLRQLAVDTGGRYWPGVERAVAANEAGRAEIVELIKPQDQVAYLPGAPDREFQLRWLGWLMTWIAGALSLEWFARRLHRLA